MTHTDSADIIEIKVMLRLSERERGIEMKNLQIYEKEYTYYALVDKHGNYAICALGEESDLCTDFRQDGAWIPVEFNDLPDWFREQLSESQFFELKKEV